MNNTDDDEEEKSWIGLICDTGEKCPRAGYWKQVETGDTVWHELDDRFSELESTPSTYKRASYEYIGKNKKVH